MLRSDGSFRTLTRRRSRDAARYRQDASSSIDNLDFASIAAESNAMTFEFQGQDFRSGKSALED